jgi:hypothetical protein
MLYALLSSAIIAMLRVALPSGPGSVPMRERAKVEFEGLKDAVRLVVFSSGNWAQGLIWPVERNGWPFRAWTW